MAELKAEYINPFLMSAKKMLQDVCFIESAIAKPSVKMADFDKSSWLIIIGVTGQMRGQIIIEMKNEVACMIASKMCMTEITAIDDFSASALSELGNMIMGNASTVFSSMEIGIDITPPTLSQGKVSFQSSYVKTLCVPLTFDGGMIDVYLLIKPEVDGEDDK